MNIENIISQLTIEEKLSLLTGKNMWETVEVSRLGIPSIRVSDGPHGVRKEHMDEFGNKQIDKAVCFPTGSALGATWNRELINQVGKAIAKECNKSDVDIILGPGTNIKRTPLCGRNFEYFSEDPLLSGELAAEYINGVQSEGVGTSLKHFAGNNQEYDRNSVSSEIDERTLREMYLKPFEIAIKKSQPWTVMCAYNRLNGIYCSENRNLLKDYLRDEFGFQGIVISDWWAVHNRAKALRATLELEMPFTEGSFEVLKEAYDTGEICISEIDNALKKLLELIFKVYESRDKKTKDYDLDSQQDLARKAASEAITLLKNEGNILPINKDIVKKIAIIGQYAVEPSIQGGGSSCTNPIKIDGAYDKILQLAGDTIKVDFSMGYNTWAEIPGVELLGIALDQAEEADMAIVFVGNNKFIEGEAHDRETLRLSFQFESLIERVANKNANTVVVIQAGSAIDMTNWIDKVKGVVFTWFSGEAAGDALGDILFGKINPSGRLSETFPLRLEDTPNFEDYPGDGRVALYSEGILVGYRYYDTKDKEVLFPFGYGLSYTSFEYSNISIIEELDGNIQVKFMVKNTGDAEGKEVPQLYIGRTASKVLRPVKELKAFDKISLMPQEEKEVIFTLERGAFAYYSVSLKKYHIESGNYMIYIGSSSKDIKLKKNVNVKGEEEFS